MSKEYKLTNGLICSEVSDDHMDELKEEVDSNNELVGLIHEPERGIVKCLISTASFAPNLRYIQ